MRKIASKKAKILFLGRSDSRVLKYLQIIGECVDFSDVKTCAKSIKDMGYEWCISHGYRHILKQDVLEIFGQRAINLHISLLPYNRGADPNFWSFVDDTPKGVSIHVMSEGVDEGDIILQRELKLNPKLHTFTSSYCALQTAIVELFANSWQGIKSGAIGPKPQSLYGGG